MSTVFLSNDGIVEVGREELERLRQAASGAPLKRARLCLHQSHSDPIQEMVIGFCHGCYIRPHRHPGGSESFHVVDGELLLVFFDDSGNVLRHIKMKAHDGGFTFLYRLSANYWHTVVPLSEYVVVHETTSGPFTRNSSEFAAWGPDESDAEGIAAFLKKIMP